MTTRKPITPITLNREQVAAIFKRFRGAQSQLARDLGVRPSAIANWLSGRSSQRIERAAQVQALALLTGCTDPDALCQPCPLRPLCTQLAKQRVRKAEDQMSKADSRRRRPALMEKS